MAPLPVRREVESSLTCLRDAIVVAMEQWAVANSAFIVSFLKTETLLSSRSDYFVSILTFNTTEEFLATIVTRIQDTYHSVRSD